MSDVDELLDGLEEDDEDSPTAAHQDSSVITELRRQLRAEKKRAKAAEEQAQANASFREKYLSTEAPKVLTEAGIDPSLAKLFVRDHGNSEFNVEVAKSWATENGIQIKEPEPQEPVTQGSEGTFAPTVGGQVPGPQKIPSTQIDQMLRNPSTMAEAVALIRSGRVEYQSPEAAAQAAAVHRR